MILEVTLEDRTVPVDVTPHPDGGWWVSVDGGAKQHVTGHRFGQAEWSFALQGRKSTFGAWAEGDYVDLVHHNHPLRAKVVDPRKAALDMAGGAGAGNILTPMPGVVVRIPVSPGDAVVAGQVVIVVEAMKMENEFKSPIDGVVERVEVEPGQALDANTTLVVITPSE